MRKIILLTLAVATMFASCQKSQEQIAEEVSGASEVVFTSGISTRATGDLWDEGDRIGVFMYEAGYRAVYDQNSSNVEYSISDGYEGEANASFTSTNPLYFLQFSDVDFMAYYPYKDGVESGVVEISTADQSSSAKIDALDFMVASATDCDQDSAPLLEFDRKMSRIVVSVVRKDSRLGAVISDAKIQNIATKATYTIENGSKTSVSPTSETAEIELFENENSQIEAIVIPQSTSLVNLFFIIDGDYFEAPIDDSYIAGKQYNYTLYVGSDKVELSASTITPWDEQENVDFETSKFPTYTASEISKSSVPSVDTWIITDSGDIASVVMRGAGVYYALQEAYKLGREITIILPNATTIGASAFRAHVDYPSALVAIEIPNVKTIGQSAFESCTNLTTISDLSGVTSIGESAFSKCSALETDIKLLKITELPNYVFSGCTNLESVEIPEVTSIGEDAFRECSSLVNVDISGVTSLGVGAFNSCSSLAIDLYMPNITTIPSLAFGSCTNLKSVNLPNVEVVESTAFSVCSSITEAYLPKATTIEYYAFNSCGSLESVDLSSATSIGNGVFMDCQKLSTLKLTTESAITCGINIFGGAGSSLTVTLYISQNNSSVENLTDGTYTFKEIVYID